MKNFKQLIEETTRHLYEAKKKKADPHVGYTKHFDAAHKSLMAANKAKRAGNDVEFHKHMIVHHSILLNHPEFGNHHEWSIQGHTDDLGGRADHDDDFWNGESHHWNHMP